MISQIVLLIFCPRFEVAQVVQLINSSSSSPISSCKRPTPSRVDIRDLPSSVLLHVLRTCQRCA